MTGIPKYILAILMIMLIACIGTTAAVVPQVCAQCLPEWTYPGSAICPQACVIAFPADTRWAYPVEKDTINEIKEKEIPEDFKRFMDEFQRLFFWFSADEIKYLTDLLMPASMRPSSSKISESIRLGIESQFTRPLGNY